MCLEQTSSIQFEKILKKRKDRKPDPYKFITDLGSSKVMDPSGSKSLVRATGLGRFGIRIRRIKFWIRGRVRPFFRILNFFDISLLEVKQDPFFFVKFLHCFASFR